MMDKTAATGKAVHRFICLCLSYPNPHVTPLDRTMRTGIITFALAALAAPLAHAIALGDGSSLFLKSNDPKTTTTWSYKNCGASFVHLFRH